MAQLNLNYYNVKEKEQYTSLQEKILSYLSNYQQFANINENEISFEEMYMFSHVRENILSWYPFKSESRILQIGSEAGAITGMLCDKCNFVTVIESDFGSAKITYERYKERSNIEVIVSDIYQVYFENKYDYIIINGISGLLLNDQFFSHISNFMFDDGTILLALDNSLGTKIISGEPDKENNQYFYSLRNSILDGEQTTLTKEQLISLCQKHQLICRKFYYPYPDYRFPTEIFTDETINTNLYGREYFQFDENRFDLIDECGLINVLKRENIIEHFANSFLVEISKQEMDFDENIHYVKINSDRNKNFRIYTKIINKLNDKVVCKCALGKESQGHILRMKQQRSNSRLYDYLPFNVKEKNSLEYEYLEYKSLDDYVIDFIEDNNDVAILGLLERVHDVFLSDTLYTYPNESPEFVDVFGDMEISQKFCCVKNINIDIIFDNIFVKENKFILIDYEWVFDFYIPTEYIMWRVINELYSKHPLLQEIIDRTLLENKFGINDNNKNNFYAWELHFAYKYVGSSKLKFWSKEKVPLNLCELAKIERHLSICSKIYYDYGRGFNEDDVMCLDCSLDNEFFSIECLGSSENNIIYNLRFTPFNRPCRLSKLQIMINNELIDYYSENGFCLNGDLLFLTNDPVIIIPDICHRVEKITISGYIHVLNNDEVYLFANRIINLKKEDEIRMNEYKNIIKEKNVELNSKKTELEEKEKELNTRIQELQCKEEELDKRDNEIKQIKSSKLWYLYKLKNRIERFTDEKEGQESFLISLDSCIYSMHYLTIKGWAFVVDEEIENLELVAKDSNSSVSIPINGYGKDRLDVYQAFGIEQALKSGFQDDFEINFSKKVTLYLCATTSTNRYIKEIKVLENTFNNIELTLKYGNQFLVPQLLSVLNGEEVQSEYSDEKVDIIVPIFNGYEYLDKLFETIFRTKIPVRCIMINDCSSDYRIAPRLEQFAQLNKQVMLLTNDCNIGFVKTVNRGLALAENHVVILNTDVELPEMWLERLMKPIFEDDMIASTTPFSNSATIFSFPQFGQNNLIYQNMSVDKLDAYFSKLSPKYTEVPTGMGFCMGMNKNVIDKIGFFDEVAFGKGYGEENDWCQRAIKAGYKNVHVENLFVYHKHGGSFEKEEKKRLMQENLKKLNKKYPNYERDVAAFCSLDPNKECRSLIQLVINSCKHENILALDHCLGGGATEYLSKRVKEWINDDLNVYIVRYDIMNMRYAIRFINLEIEAEYVLKDFEELFVVFELFKLSEIIINELVTYPDLFSIMNSIIRLKQKTNAKLIMLVHDFFSICPSINLLAGDSPVYCREGEGYDCNACFDCLSWSVDYSCDSIQKWHDNWSSLLSDCDEVRTFSKDSCEKIRKIYPMLGNLTIVPHTMNYMIPVNQNYKITKTYNIGIIGVLSEHKGKERIRELLELIKLKQLNIKIVLIGEVDGDKFSEDLPFYETGRYEVQELPGLVLKNDIDVFFVASIWPETFSYTTEEVKCMEMPLVCYPIGAPFERIEEYEKGYVLKSNITEEVLKELIEFGKYYINKKKMVIKKKILFIADEYTFSTRYRVSHLQEQLIYGGIESDFLLTDDINMKMDFSMYDSILLYRCSYSKVMKNLIKKCKDVIPIIYDIDDYIFDYNAIATLDFLKDAEYSKYKSYTGKIRKCMELCDYYTTSTNHLAKAIESTFNNQVFVNRNLASLEMKILSNLAVLEKRGNDNSVIIGYFSGSKTHNSDFKLIEDVLIEIMKKYKFVELLIVGTLSLSEKFNIVEHRIHQKGFVSWKQLPQLVASVDINLMPLEQNFFNCCKSENKWMEAGLVKVATVASFNEELEGVTKNNENILLCKDYNEWFQALEELITNVSFREKIAQNAFDYVNKYKITSMSYKDICEIIMNVN